jgi:hypothetical protein
MMTGSETRFLTEKRLFRITGNPKNNRCPHVVYKKPGFSKSVR